MHDMAFYLYAMRFLFISLILLLPFVSNAQKWVALDNDVRDVDAKEAQWLQSNATLSLDTVVIKDYLIGNIENLNHQDAGLVLLNEVESPKAHHYLFAQTLNGRKVFRSSVKVNIANNGKILSLFDHTLAVSGQVDTEFPDHGPYHEGLMVHYRTPYNGRLDHYDLEEVYIENQGELIPAIRLEVVEQTDRYYELVLNKEVKVVYQNDLLEYAAPQDSVVTVWVFNPDPLTTANQSYGAPYADSFDQDVLELNAERVPVQVEATLENDTFFLQNDFARIHEFSFPEIEPATSLTPEFNFTRSASGFEDVNAFYHITYFQNYIQSLGFTNLANYRMDIDAHALNGADNSNFNGGFNPPQLKFGEGGVDDAEDADVIIHEYGHAISHSAAPNTNNGTQRKALDEAIGDYYASSYSRFLNSNRWSDVFTWDGHNEFWDGRSSVSTDHYPEDLNNNLYTDADIWAATLMQIWSDIGREATDAIMMQANYSFSEGMTMPQAALLFIQADTLLFGGANFTPIRQRMFDRGLIPWNVGVADVNPEDEVFRIYNTSGFANGTTAVRVVCKESFVAVLYNALGQELRSFPNQSGQLSVSSAGLNSGVYLLELVSKNHRKTIKLLKH